MVCPGTLTDSIICVEVEKMIEHFNCYVKYQLKTIICVESHRKPLPDFLIQLEKRKQKVLPNCICDERDGTVDDVLHKKLCVSLCL